jgi:23S rRNA pseudouridine1911/1915/1917 synthase
MSERATGGEPWTVTAEEAGAALAAFLRGRLAGHSWSVLKRYIATGKVFVDGSVTHDEGLRVVAGQHIEVCMTAPRPRDPLSEVRLVFEDAHLVVIDKPSGVSSVPYEERETGTAMDLVRDAWRRLGRPATASPLFVVHRIDKETSGLLVFAKTKLAERALGARFRAHDVERTYLAVAHGVVPALRVESRLVPDRGDGLRGASRRPGQGKRAVTHVRPLRRLVGATLVECRLETGKTHQIRIHLSENGHPIVGEKVYIRDYTARGGEPLVAPRLLLHAATLGLVHPVSGERLSWEAPLPADFEAALRRLGG